MSIVYQVTNSVNSKSYVGVTKRTLDRRWYEHKHYKFCPALGSAISKYGCEVFTVHTLAQFDDAETLALAEKLFIVELNTKAPNGYNLTEGGETASEWKCRKISKSRKGQKQTTEHIANHAAALRGKPSPKKGRHYSTHCVHGHNRTPDNVNPANGSCRICARDAKRRAQPPHGA